MKVRYFRQQIPYSTIAILLVTGLGPARALIVENAALRQRLDRLDTSSGRLASSSPMRAKGAEK